MTYLELLKQRGKTLVLKGPQGCGKGLLYRQLIGKTVYYATGIDAIIDKRPGFKMWVDEEIKFIVVEGFPGAKDIEFIKSLVNSRCTICDRKGKEPVQIDTPIFIFCTSDKDIPDDQSFCVLEMGDLK